MDLKPKILIVDDRPENLVALRTVLRDLDIELVEATSGNEALKATLHHNFALALLDIQMPDMDGYELAGILREEEKTSDMPFIFISAVYTDNLNVFKGYERGAFSFITKPFQPEILINKVRFFIEKHHQEITLHQLNSDLQKKTIELESKEDELAQSSRYKSEFLANMSHELRTPLNSILLLSKLLADNPEKNLTPDQVEFASVIHNSGSSLLELINEILDLSKIEAGKMQIDLEEISVQTICKNIADLFTPLAREKKIDFSVTLTPGLPGIIQTDKLRLEQVLKNFLSNALKFTEEGSVELIVRTPLTLPESFNTTQAQNFIEFEVKDSGIGIPKEKHALIFNAFQQADGSTRRKYGGTGLGLSISREIVRMLGGEIILESEPGKGSSFKVVLPVG